MGVATSVHYSWQNSEAPEPIHAFPLSVYTSLFTESGPLTITYQQNIG